MAAPASLLAIALFSCDSPLGPSRPFDAPPALIDFSFRDDLLRDGGALVLSSVPVDDSFRLSRGTYLAVEISTSRGDEEQLRLTPMFCGDDRCSLATLRMQEGEPLLDYEPSIRNAGGRLLRVYFSVLTGDFGSVWVTEGTAQQFAERMLSHPAVEFAQAVERDDFFPESLLEGALPISSATVQPRNGTLSVVAGDTVFARYVSVSGDTLARQWILPELFTP